MLTPEEHEELCRHSEILVQDTLDHGKHLVETLTMLERYGIDASRSISEDWSQLALLLAIDARSITDWLVKDLDQAVDLFTTGLAETRRDLAAPPRGLRDGR